VSAERQNEVEQWNPVKADGVHSIPAYIPYIGAEYFSPQVGGRRILAYALSQNLSETDQCARDWAQDWREGGEQALDRQNIAFREAGIAVMHPFDTGHIPILASLLRSAVSGRCSGSSESIYPQTAATNLSKFSFRSKSGRLTVERLEALRQCWKWFSELEVRLLKPDYILCCDQRVYDIVKAGVAQAWPDTTDHPLILWVSFPSLRVINRHYRKQSCVPHPPVGEMAKRISAADIDRPVAHGHTIRTILRRDEYYFAEMLRRMERRCQQ